MRYLLILLLLGCGNPTEPETYSIGQSMQPELEKAQSVVTPLDLAIILSETRQCFLDPEQIVNSHVYSQPLGNGWYEHHYYLRTVENQLSVYWQQPDPLEISYCFGCASLMEIAGHVQDAVHGVRLEEHKTSTGLSVFYVQPDTGYIAVLSWYKYPTETLTIESLRLAYNNFVQ